MLELTTVTVASLVAGFVNAIAGGGGLIAVPVLFSVFPAAPPATLFGTSKAAMVWGTAWAAADYSRHVQLPWKTLLPACLAAVVGGFAGAWLVTLVSADWQSAADVGWSVDRRRARSRQDAWRDPPVAELDRWHTAWQCVVRSTAAGSRARAKSPMLYRSLAIKRQQQAYYENLTRVRNGGDWEGWTAFYLDCVREAADDGVRVAKQIFSLLAKDRSRLIARDNVTVPAVRLLELLPSRPVVTLPLATKLLRVSTPTAIKAIAILVELGILRETSGKRRDRVYA